MAVCFTAEETVAQTGGRVVKGQYREYGTGLLTSYLAFFLQPALNHQSQVRWNNDPRLALFSETQ